MTAILLLHAAATLAMCGVIWFVQIVHYPLFALAARPDFGAFAAAHQRRTGVVVAPLMLAELTSAAALALAPPPGRAIAAGFGISLLAVIWASTALVQVPLHRRLARGFDRDAHRRLVGSNWLRTAAWTGRAALALVLLTPPSG